MQAFIRYIKEDDIETCVNALFVLTESKPEILEKLMRGLDIKKKELIDMMISVLKGNYQTYNDALSFGGSKPFFKPYIAYPQIPYWQQNHRTGDSS